MNESQTPQVYTYVVLQDISKPSPYTGRIYPKQELLDAIEHFERSNPLPVGELDHPISVSMTVDFSRVSHKIVKTYLRGNTWLVDITIMKTAMGTIAQTLLDNDVPLRLSPRGLGEVDKDNKITKYKLITFDILSTVEQQVQA